MWSELTPRLQIIFWSVVGLLVALAMFYMLYRMTLPIQPFIYQAF